MRRPRFLLPALLALILLVGVTPAWADGGQPGGGLLGLPTSIPLGPLQLPLLPPIQLPNIQLPAIPGLTAPGSAAAGPLAPDGLAAYRGLGAWISLYGYGNPGDPAPDAIVSQMASRGVQTIFVQTARWTSGGDLDFPGALGALIDDAHAQGMKVVGWYLPGFANVTTDIRRSAAVLTYVSPGGGRFDGFAADIEDHGATGSLQQFNAGITAYAQGLRAAVPAGTTLGAIVPDARNDKRAPAHWAGFPWPQIGADFDVVEPMAYWTVTKANATCQKVSMDVTAYMDDVIATTESLMGVTRPMAPMGGISNCVTQPEVTQYVAALQAHGAIGGGLYDFWSLQARPDAGTLWSDLAGLRG
ncbi:MAG TPA: hypothetical protein VFW71_00715 [Actinomycetota bacterium]|nr:hypothetical protein [Actinomycetota bacterium]